MESDVSFPSYHGIIDCQTAIDRLGTISKPGTYLVRYFGNKYIISYLDEILDIKHITVTTKKDSHLWKCNPHITDIKTAVEFLLSLDSKRFAHLVPCQNFDIKQNPAGIRGDSSQCNICDYKFKDDKDRSLHPRKHMVGFCDECLSIIPKASFTSHLLSCAKEKMKKVHRCDKCSFFTKFSNSLKTHKIRHTKASIKCLKCEEMFTTTGSMENHMVKLHGYHRFKCNHCRKHFSTKAHLDRHKNKVHNKVLDKSQNILVLDQDQKSENLFGYISFKPSTTPLVYRCDQCAFFSTHQKNLLRHMKNVSHELTVLSF